MVEDLSLESISVDGVIVVVVMSCGTCVVAPKSTPGKQDACPVVVA